MNKNSNDTTIVKLNDRRLLKITKIIFFLNKKISIHFIIMEIMQLIKRVKYHN